MNNIFLKNNNLTVKISTLGAEIQSLKKSEKKSTFGKEIPIYGGSFTDIISDLRKACRQQVYN